MAINFISSKDFDETCSMLTKSNNIEIMMGTQTKNIVEEIRNFVLQKYKKGLDESMTGSNFYFDSADLLYYHLQKQV